MDKLMFIDGYNVIGLWPHLRSLREQQLAQARELLIDSITNYQAYTGIKCIIVFDGYKVNVRAARQMHSKVEVHFTNRTETADTYIERHVRAYMSDTCQVYVATSDHRQQIATFALGALRVPVMELLEDVQRCAQQAHRVIAPEATRQNTFDHFLSPEQRAALHHFRKQK
ncbi:MAG: NYN domain-containing protein [Paenibacillaceae bacterium]|nr:NYN domain-containing protein [Paenibacillaceae bacterium]